MTTRSRLPAAFFARSTLTTARELLGQLLVRVEDGCRISGIIVETEAYIGTQDLGCHARSGQTPRNASMWGPPGQLYVYFTYGMHWMLNIVTEEGIPAAVLIRALIPFEGLNTIRKFRMGKPDRILTDGPAKLCQGLNITGELNGQDSLLPDSPVFIERLADVPEEAVTTSPRIGLNSVPEPWKSIPWRFAVHREWYNQLQNSAGNKFL